MPLPRPRLKQTANIFFVRHGETGLNAEGRIQGHTDTHGLNEAGRAQVEALAAHLAASGAKADAVFVSPMRRAVESAAILTPALGMPAEIIEALKELGCGRCEGLTHAEIESITFDPPHVFPDAETGEDIVVTSGKVLRQYYGSDDPRHIHFSHPGGETKAQVVERTTKAVFAAIEAREDAENLWFVCHGAVIRLLAAHFNTAAGVHGVGNAEIVHFTYDAAAPDTLAYQGRLRAPPQRP